MALALVDRGVRAIAEQLNAYYRVFRGLDPDSLYLRLNPSGSFQVRHSSTNAAVFTVNDGGIAGSISGGNIQNESITSAQIQNGTIDTADLKDGAVTSAKILDDTITNADINANAAIQLNKLNHVGAGNVLKSNGTTNVAGQVASGDIADQAITDADVNNSAAIVVAKLADLGANNVLRSNGAGNLAGKVVTNDMAVNTINGDRLLDNSVPPIKLSGGIPPPINTIDSTHIIDGSIQPADLAAGAGMRRLVDSTLGAASAAIDVTNLAQQYGDLRITLLSSNTTLAASNVHMRFSFDGTTFDATGPYDVVFQNQGSTSAATGGVLVASNLIIGSHYQSYLSTLVAEIPGYASSYVHHVYSRWLFSQGTNVGDYTMGSAIGLHRTNVSPIRGFRLIPSAGTFAAGARLVVYGMPGTLG